MQPLIAMAALTALAAFRVARLVAGTIGLAARVRHHLGRHRRGKPDAVRFTLPIRIGAFLAAVSLWRWPWLRH
jgi:hypothetical protein